MASQAAAFTRLLARRPVWLGASTAVLLLAAALRIVGLNARPLWFDEAIEYWMSAAPFAEVHLAVAEATHDPPFYSYLLHLWRLTGIQDFWLRLPSLAFSLFGVAGVIRLGELTGGRAVGLLAGLLLTVSAADVRYAQEVGQYSMLVCLVSWNALFLLQAHAHNRWRWWLLWGATAGVGLYSHYGMAIAVFALAATVIALNLRRRRWTAVWRHALTGGGVLLLLLPLFLIIIPRQLGRLGASAQPVSLADLLAVSNRILAFQLLGNEAVFFQAWPGVPMWLLAAPLTVGIGIALLTARKWLHPPVLLLIMWLGYYGISRTGAYFFNGTRHSLLLTPLMMVSAAIGIWAVARRVWPLAAAVTAVAVLMALFIPRERPEDLRTVTDYWLAQQQAGDATYVYYGAVPGFSYRLDLLDGETAVLPRAWYVDCYIGTNVPACRADGVAYGPWLRGQPEIYALSVRELTGATDRLWLIFSHVHGDEEAQFLSALSDAYTVADQIQATNGSAYLLQKSEPASADQVQQ